MIPILKTYPIFLCRSQRVKNPKNFEANTTVLSSPVPILVIDIGMRLGSVLAVFIPTIDPQHSIGSSGDQQVTVVVESHTVDAHGVWGDRE